MKIGYIVIVNKYEIFIVSKSNKVTRDDVARLAGTSSAVVSYVINNGPRPVAEATKKRVLEAIKKTGYRPNSIARTLVSGSSHSIGLIVPNLSNPFVASLSHCISLEALKRGYVLLLGDSNDDEKIEKGVINHFIQRQVDGILYYTATHTNSSALIASANTPFVLLNRCDGVGNYHAVLQDERLAAQKAVNLMLERGYRHVAIVAGPASMENTQQRIKGWEDAYQEKNLTIDESLIMFGDYSRLDGYILTKCLIQKGKCDAIFTTNELQALGCMRAIYEAGLSIPNDLGLMTFNATELSSYVSPALYAVSQSLDSLASKAFDLLLNSYDPSASTKEYVDSIIIKGNSLVGT